MTSSEDERQFDTEKNVNVKHVEGKKPVHPILWNLMILAG